MKVIICTGLLVLLSTQVFSQAISDSTVLYLRDSIASFVNSTKNDITKDSADYALLSDDAYDEYLGRFFTQINYDRDGFTDGNSASLKVADDKTSLNLTLSKKSNSDIVSVGTVLNVKDNSGTLFTGNQPTAGTQFNVLWSHLVSRWRLISYFDDVRFANYHSRRAMSDSIYNLYVLKNPNLLVSLKSALITQSSAIDSLKNKLKEQNLASAARTKTQQNLADAIDKREKTITQLNGLSYSKSKEDALEDIKESVNDKRVKKELSTEGVTWSRIAWTSVGGNYRKDTYKTYDSSLPVSKRADEKPFDGLGLTLALNMFTQRTQAWIDFSKKRGLQSFYGSVTYNATLTNTFADLKETNYSAIKSTFSNDTTYQLTTTDKLRNVTGITFQTFVVQKFGVQLTGMMGKKQFFGLNISSNVETSKKKGTTYNSRFGLLFRFIDSADQKSKVNFELFLALNDFKNVNKAKGDLWDRRQIGISASVPFQKVFFK